MFGATLYWQHCTEHYQNLVNQYRVKLASLATKKYFKTFIVTRPELIHRGESVGPT